MELKTSGMFSFLLLPAVAFIGNTILGMLFLVIPIYAYSLGAKPVELGLVGASGALVYSFMPFLMGGFSDKIGQIKIIILALALIGSVSILYVFASSPLLIILLKVFEGICWAMLWPAIEAGISSLSEGLDIGLGRYNISWSSGATFGPLLAGFVMAFLGVHGVFYLSSVTAVFTSFFVLISMRGLKVKKAETGDVGFKHALNALKSSGFLNIPLTSNFLCYFITSIVFTFFPPYAVSRGLSALEVGFLAFLHGVARTISFLLVKRLQGKFRSTILVELSTPLLGISSALLYLEFCRLAYYVSFVITGVLVGLIYSISLLMIMSGSGSRRGLYAGIFESTIGFGSVVGPLVGSLTSSFGLSAPFLLCG
ncbi:MAG: MFS transporter, partial [Candidatus Bathyarchaeia archaeon]